MARRRISAPRIPIKSERDVAFMRRAGRIVALTLQKVGEALTPGITTGELDAIAERTIRGMGAIPAFLNYNGFPATACLSVNDEVVHGIPGDKVLREGDILGVDLGAIVEGWYADSAFTFPVGKVSDEAVRLMEAGKGSLAAAISSATVGNRLRDIGAAVQKYAEERGYGVVRDLCGHGIGRHLHEDPQIPNYVTYGGNLVLQAGMTLAIEPMLNAGRPEVKLAADGWTFRTEDGTLSVHYEHTVLIHPDGPEILTPLR